MGATMSWIVEARNAAVDLLSDRVVTARIHSDAPGATGADNRIGNALAITYAVSVNGVASLSNAPLEFPVGAGVTVKFVTYYDGLGVLQRTRAVVNETFAADGVYEVTSADISMPDEV
jgi:hypothetical protein